MADSVNMSLDEIIKQSKQNRTSRSRGRGGRGVGRGRGRGGNRGGQSRPGTPSGNRQGRSRSRSRGPRGQSQPRGRSQSRNGSKSRGRSRSRRQYRSASRGRSRSRSNLRGVRGLTPKGRAGLEDQTSEMPPLVRRGRGGGRNRPWRGNRGGNQRGGSIQSRLGMTTRQGLANGRPLAVAKRGIIKRGGLRAGNRYSAVGLRSDQILQERRQNLLQLNSIRSQTFRRSRSRNNSFSSPSQLTVSVANDFGRKRRNSVGSAGYLSQRSLAQLTNQFGGYNQRRGPGSVKSVGSNRSYQSNASKRSNRSNRGRRGGANRGVGRKFVKQTLNPKLQKEIAAIQGKAGSSTNSSPTGINFSPTPFSTGQSLHERFGTL